MNYETLKPLIIGYTAITILATLFILILLVKMWWLDYKEFKAEKKDKAVREHLDWLLESDEVKIVMIDRTNPNK